MAMICYCFTLDNQTKAEMKNLGITLWHLSLSLSISLFLWIAS